MAKEKGLLGPRGRFLLVLFLVHFLKTRRGHAPHISTLLAGNDQMLDFLDKKEKRKLWGKEEKCHSLQTEGLSKSYQSVRVLFGRPSREVNWDGGEPAWVHMPDLPISNLGTELQSKPQYTQL